VFSDPFLFLEVHYYSKYPGECILILPSDFKAGTTTGRSSPDPYMHQRVELILSSYYPLKFWQMDQVGEHAKQAALIKPTQDVEDAMKEAGLESEVRFSQPLKILYLP
jgi:hypothetical protein